MTKPEEYDFDKFTEDSSDDHPKYGDGIDWNHAPALPLEDRPSDVPRPRTPFSKKTETYKKWSQNDDWWNYEDMIGNGNYKDPVEVNIALAEDDSERKKLSKGKMEELLEEVAATNFGASEVNRQFDTGAQRDSGNGKSRHSLIPHEELDRVAKRYLDGAEKYGENNWMKGMPLSVYYDSAMRHMQAWWSGDENEDHAAAAVWNMLCAMWTEDNADIHLADKGEFLDDRHKYPRD